MRAKTKITKTKKCYMHQNQNTNSKHIPVLLDEVLRYLAPKKGESYLDLTSGYGGHAAAILERTASAANSVLVDRDEQAVSELRQLFAGSGVSIRQQDFLSASQELTREGKQFDLVLADLGVSSPHLDRAERGFAFTQEARLDMRMDTSQPFSAADIVNGYDENELSEVLHLYGEEPKARQIARLIVRGRPILTTTELARTVAKAWPGHSRVHPATRTFQALRIVVNDEMNQLQRSLPLWIGLLKPGGRIAVISFHSLEDRLVKQEFQALAGDRYDATLRLLIKRPATAQPNELVFNPRARSAKLRAAVKINTKERNEYANFSGS